MAQLKWNNKARSIFAENIRYAYQEFGQATAFRWFAQKQKIEERLRKQPESFSPEPLIARRRVYRKATIMRNFKIIFFYSKASDTVRIVDIWDARMNPDTLRRRLK